MHVTGNCSLNLKTRLAQIIRFLGIGSLLFQTACSIDLSIWSEHGDVLSGKVQMPGITSSAACAAGTKIVTVHQLNPDGSVDETPWASTSLESDYSFKFTNFFKTAPSSNLFLKVEACGKQLTRPVTGMTNQTVSYTTSIVGLAPYVQLGGIRKLPDLGAGQIDALIASIEAAPGASTSESMSEVYDALVAGSGATQRAQVVAGLGLTDISDLVSMVPPYIANLTSPASYPEMSSATHTVTAAHWYGSYSAAYEWTLNGTHVGTNATYTFTPTKNSQGANIVGLKIGTNDGSGNIDTSLAVLDKAYTVTVQNTFPAIAPALSLTSNAVTNSITAALAIDTGASLVNCDTFSTFAISESATSAGVAASDFNRTCSTNTTQSENYAMSMSDGIKTIYLWSKDSAGNISATPTSVTVKYDTTAPTLSLTGVPTVIAGSTAMSLTFSATDSLAGIALVKLQYSADDITYTDVATLTAATSPYTGYTPTASGYMRLYAEDNAGNSNATTGLPFVYDNTPPNAPSPTLTSAAITNNTQVTFTVPNCTDTSYILFTESAGAPAAGNTSWVACNTATTYTHTITGETTHTIYVWAKDTANNVSATSGSLSVILDVTPPTVTWVAPTTDVRVSTATTVSWRVTDIHTSTSQNTVLQYSEDAGVTWSTLSTQALPANSVSNQTYTYTWTTPATTKNARLRVVTTDSATNQRTITKDLIVESERPVIDTFTLADGATIVGISSVNAALSVTASTSVTSYMRFSETDFDVNTDNGVGWIPFSASGMSYALSSSPGNHTVYAQIKNNAGIMSLTKSYTLKLELGTPPVIKVTSPSGSGTYVPGNVMPITWNCTSSDVSINLASPPISSIQYTIDDGRSYHTIVDSTMVSLAASGTYNWTIPATTSTGQTISSTTPIRVLVACKTEGGIITTALSAIQNSTWQILAGDPGNLEYGVHLSAVDMSSWNGIFADSNSNMYSGSKLRHAIMKIDRQTGIASEWLGSMSVAGCPTATVAQFTIPRIIDITNGEMTIVSPPCSTITRIKISDKSIVWNRVVSQLNGDERTQISNPSYDAYLKSGYYYFPSYHSGLIRPKAYYELDLNTISSTPKLIIGSGTDCTNSTPSVGAAGDTIPLPCQSGDYNGWIAPMPDRTKVYIYHRTGTTSSNRFEMTYDTTTSKWLVSSTSASVSNLCSRVMYVGNDTSKYFCMLNARSGNVVSFVDTATGNYGGSSVSLSSFKITEFQGIMGSSNSSVYVVSRETNELFEIKYNSGFTANKIGGTPFLTYGNGTDVSLVGFTSISGLAYDPVNNYLYTRGLRHLRRMKIDTTTTPGSPFISQIDTAYPSVINTVLNSYGALLVDPTGSRILMNTGSTSGYKWEGQALSPAAWPDGANADLSTYVGLHTGTSGTAPTLGTPFDYNTIALWDWGSTATFMADNSMYFASYSNNTFTSNLAIYKATTPAGTDSIVAIAGKSGTPSSTSFTDGATALGVGFSRIYGMQEDSSGELLVYDENRVVQITAKSSSSSPKAYLVHDLTTFTNYPTGKTWIDAVHDNATGWNYFLANDVNTGVTEVYAANDTTKTFESIPVTGLDLPGTKPGNRGKAFYLKVTPLGLLMQDAYKRRILVTPLKP
ncbi:hypothetical protein B9G69_010015 [Bdellovibrio sp. SKB1291214]|uniref:hypothetical protein n=1 Tax=Bdellovibrio sp. SKB1291214 TaxID=1732569 RepID=UPI000B51BD4D|nr:hypothetical protein [Bdellovibrio sp. SKB1291214]UYL07380.1 hypothetical protein B9G69_010015 [Bdellovibrio sp. SKB1291214]